MSLRRAFFSEPPAHLARLTSLVEVNLAAVPVTDASLLVRSRGA